jgi:hypothetical protein
MNNVIVFTPKAERDATRNLGDFVLLCSMQLTILCTAEEYPSHIWDVTDALQLKAKGNKRERVFFTTLASVKDRVPEVMSDPFIGFAKAYLRYQHGMRPTKAIGSRLAALRLLEAALLESGDQSDVTSCRIHTFDRAAAMACEVFSPAVAFRIGGQLEMIAEFLTEHHLVSHPVAWRNFIKRPIDTVRVGPEFDQRRHDKLPSREVLDAIPQAFRLATEPSDVLVTSIVAIFLSAPDRAHEVLLLPSACIVDADDYDQMPDCLGLRWWPGKGAVPMIKWIPTVMNDTVREAIQRIQLLTDEPRAIAKWYEEHPQQIFLRSDSEQLRRKEYLDMIEVAAVIFGWGVTMRTVGLQWCKSEGIETTKIGKKLFAKFADVERAVLAKLPIGFPLIASQARMPYSEALLVVRKNEFHATRSNWVCMIEGVTVDKVNERLGTGSPTGKQSVFDRLGFISSDGSSLKVTTHQFRHYLDTIAQSGGMDQLDLARWAGRRDVKQNAVYNHVTPEERIAQLRGAIGTGSGMIGPLSDLPVYMPIARDEFARLKIQTAHVTDFGMCIHDYTMTPCQKFMDCINCNEQVCKKGDQERMDAAKRRLSEIKTLALKAELDAENGYYNASIWLEKHKETQRHLEQLCSIYEDPTVPDGSIIQLSIPKAASRADRALEQRRYNGIEGPEVVSKMGAMTDTLRGLLGVK